MKAGVTDGLYLPALFGFLRNWNVGKMGNWKNGCCIKKLFIV